MPILLPGSHPPSGPAPTAAAHWDAPGLRWDRADLFWDLPVDWLVIPFLFGYADPVAETPWLDADFDAIRTHLNARKDPSMALLTVPYTFATAGLHTPTARLDANFAAVSHWTGTWPGRDRAPVPYLFSTASQNTPLNRLDANFAAVADWWNTSLP